MKRPSLLKRIVHNKHRILIITLMLILILGVVTNHIRLLENVFLDSEDSNLAKYEDYLEVVGKSKECGNITVTLESAVADRNILMISFLVNNSEGIKELNDADIHISSLTINGKEKYLISKNNLELINDNQARIVKRISWDYDNLPNNINVSIGIERMFEKDGNWDIKFNVDTYKILQNTYYKKINSSINLKDLRATIKNVIISPLTIKIESRYVSNNKDRLGFLVLDKDDNELVMLDEDTSKNFEGYEYVAKYISNEPLENLKIIPVYYNHSESNKEESSISNKINLEEFHQFYLNINKNLAVKIEDYIVDGKYIILKYNYEYMGKVIMKDLNQLYLKCDDVIYNEKNSEEIDAIKRNYYSSDYKVAVFEGINSNKVEIGCYDDSYTSLLEDYAFEVEK